METNDIKKQKISKDDILNETISNEILKKYGKLMTIEEYKNNFKIMEKEYKTMIPPFISSPSYVKEITISKPSNCKRVFKSQL
jgi:hypothetical protein